MNKIIFTFFLFLITAPLLANTGGLSFSLVPTKSIQAGKTALLILPVRILESSCRYEIKTKGVPNYPVQAPTELISENDGQSIVYLPFSVQIPASAPSGQLYTLTASFHPGAGCTDKEPISHDLLVNIQSFEDLSIEGGTEKVTQTSTSGQVDLALKNTGNQNLNLSLQIESFTPTVRIEARPSQVSIAPGEFKKVKIYIDFSASGADFASFKVQAMSGSQKFLSKNYQIRLLKGTTTSSDGRQLQSQFYLTNEFFSEGGQNRNYTSAGASMNGDLSDYYALSTYIQSTYLQGENESVQYEMDLTKHEEFRVTIGSSLNPAESSTPGIRQLQGIRASKSFFETLNVGVYGGVDQMGHEHIGGFVDNNKGYKSRYLVFWDKNIQTGFDAGGMSLNESFRLNSRLAIAPSLVLAKDELRGNYSRVGTSLNALMTKYAPLQAEVYREEDNRYVSERLNAQVIIPYKNTNTEIGVNQDNIRSKSADYDSLSGMYRDAYVKILFPITRNTQGQMQIKYQQIPDGTSLVSPEIVLTHSSRTWQGYVRAGQQLNRNSQSVLSGASQGISNSGRTQAEQYVQLDLQYKPSSQYSFYAKADYYREADTNYYRYQYGVGGQYNINDKSFVSAGIRANYQYNFYENESYTFETQYNHKVGRNFDVQAYASHTTTRGINQNDTQVGVRLTWTPGVPVSRRVENTFGGKKTAQIDGRVCFDLNQNKVCDGDDLPIKGAEVRIEGMSFYTDNLGNFSFKNIYPGSKEIFITRETLPSQVNVDETSTYYDFRANDIVRKDFALEWSGALKVIVFEDKNGDGIYQQETESQLPDVEIELTGNQKTTKAISSSYKPNVFNKLKKGTYIVKISKPLPGSTPVHAHGLKVELPNSKGEWVYLGLTFDDIQTENDLSVVTTQTDSVIYADTMNAGFIVEDPDMIIGSMKLRCGDKTINVNHPKKASFEIEVNVSTCKETVKNGELKLDMDLTTKGGVALKVRKFEFLIY